LDFIKLKILTLRKALLKEERIENWTDENEMA